MLWLKFITCAGVILFFGSRLSSHAHKISEKGLFSAGLMGVLFLSVITSCPEVFTSLGSITVVNAPDLAAGDLIGAVIINALSVALFALFLKKKLILKKQSPSNMASALLTILMLGILIGSLGARSVLNLSPGIFSVGLDSILIGAIYIAGMIIICRRESAPRQSGGAESVPASLWIKFAVSSAVIISSGFWLARIGKEIADTHGWGEMWVGLIFMAAATTLPEFIVSLTAIRLNSAHMAVGNYLGSNFFNIFIFFILDVFSRKGQFLSSVSISNIYPAFLAMILSAALLAVMIRKRN